MRAISVRKTSRALGQNSDSSARYEKGVDRHSPELGLARALHLIQELDCGDITTLEFDLTDGRPIGAEAHRHHSGQDLRRAGHHRARTRP